MPILLTIFSLVVLFSSAQILVFSLLILPNCWTALFATTAMSGPITGRAEETPFVISVTTSVDAAPPNRVSRLPAPFCMTSFFAKVARVSSTPVATILPEKIPLSLSHRPVAALMIGLSAFASSAALVLSRNVPIASFAAVSSPLVFAVLMKLPILPKRPFLPNKPVSPPPSVLAPCVRIAVNTLFNVSSVVTSFSILVIISLTFVTTCVDFMLPRIEFFQFSL